MKLLTIGLTLLISSTASAGWMNCSFRKSEVINAQTGEVLSRGSSPKIIRAARDLDLIQNGRHLLIYTSFGNHIHHVGLPNCSEPGDCFTVQTYGNPIREYTVTFGENRKSAVLSTYVNFGNLLEETYTCRL